MAARPSIPGRIAMLVKMADWSSSAVDVEFLSELPDRATARQWDCESVGTNRRRNGRKLYRKGHTQLVLG
jgi:hypothetical protein